MKIDNPAPALARILSVDPTSTLSMAAWDRATADFRMQRLEMSQELADEFQEIASQAVRYLSTSSLRRYSAGYKPDDHEVQVLPLEDAPEIAAIFDEVSRPGRLDPFQAEGTFVRNLRFYANTLQAKKEGAVFLRAYGPAKALQRSGKFAAFFTGEVFDKLDDSALLFDQNVDVISYSGSLYILNDPQFRRVFRIAEALREQALQALGEMHARFPIANFDEFSEACLSQVQMMSKAIGIPGKSYFKTLTMESVRKVIVDYQLDLTIQVVDGTESLLFEKALEKRWLVLKVLDDDYLRSAMTDLKYEVNSKAEWG